MREDPELDNDHLIQVPMHTETMIHSVFTLHAHTYLCSYRFLEIDSTER